MSLRPSELDEILPELSAGLVGAFVQKAFAPLPRLCFLELRLPGRSVTLCLCAEPQFARICVAARRFPSPSEPPSFQRWLRQELIGAKLVRIDRIAPSIVVLRFERQGVTRQLAVELRGTGANIVLLDDADRVIAASVSEPERTRPGAQFVFESAPAPEHLPSRLRPVPGAAFPYAEAAEALFGTAERQRRAREVRRRLAGPIKAKLARLNRTLEKVEADASRGDEAERHRVLGELLAHNLHAIPRGTKTVRLTHYTERGPEEVEVTLDPRRTPKEEAAWHFHQYRRLTHGIEHATRRWMALQAERDALQRELEALDELSEDELLEKVDLLAAPKRRGPERAKPYKTFIASNGARILVGKNAEANDELTFRIARPFDYWLHARGVPGSHVILEGVKGQPPDPEALIDAAHLAHHHSQRKAEPSGEVVYTQVKFVRKRKGEGAGAVVISREKGIHVRVEAARLERLLGTRVEG